MKIVEVRGSNYIEECWSLFELHREELTTHKHIMILKPDVERYKKLDELGLLVTLLVYEDDHIIGYSVNILGSNLHYSDLLMLQNDILFIHPKYRKGSLGTRLIQETEKIAQTRTGKFIVFHAKKGTAFELLLEKMGYSVQDIIYSKEI